MYKNYMKPYDSFVVYFVFIDQPKIWFLLRLRVRQVNFKMFRILDNISSKRYICIIHVHLLISLHNNTSQYGIV